MLVAFLVAERIDDLLQSEGFVDHRTQTVGIDCPHHRLLLGSAADQYPLQADLAYQCLHQRQLASDPGENSDQRNVPANTRGDHRLLERRRAAHFDDVIHPTIARELAYRFAPGRCLAVVDQVIGAHGLEAFEFLVTGRGGNHRGAGQFGELQGEDRNTASALHQHGIARLE
ncbi:hypothetical protein D3C78_434100 [compost metagenome]